MTTAEKLTVGRVTVELSNTAKVLFPADGITKGDLVEYYHAVTGTMLPLLRDRPVSMTRFPDGIASGGIVQKNVPAYAYAQLAVAPYSVRARPGAPVATPLSWDELDDQALRPGQFTLRTVPRRIREAGQAGDPWAELARRRPGLARAQESLRRLTA